MTAQELATRIKIPHETIQKQAQRQGWGLFYKNEQLSVEELKKAIAFYSVRNAHRTDEQLEAVQALATELGITSDVSLAVSSTDRQEQPQQERQAETKTESKTVQPTNAPQTKRQKTNTPQTKKEYSIDDYFLITVFLVAMIFQMHHTAHVVSIVEKGAMAMFWGWLYAVALQFTALLVTVRLGGIWKLALYAVLEFFINLLYYAPWDTAANYTEGAIHIVISFGIAFSIYVYAHLYTLRHAEKNKQLTETDRVSA